VPQVLGDVKIGKNSSIWYSCVLRGDVNYIQVGVETNIQDNTLVHVAKTNVSGNVAPTIIGDKVTFGKSFQFSLTRTSPVVCI
jgi:carbonic anhydrase/acetyltransferase-like protein (isoleucine patch superfamily)